MDEIIEQFAEKFTNEFRQNSDLRIEGFLEENILPDELSSLEIVEVYKELIALEVDMRFDALQRIDRYDYKRRFPEYESHIDAVVDHVISLPRDDDSDTQVFTAGQVFEKDAIQTKGGPLQKPPESIGRFRDIEVVGRGSFGVVCKAFDTEAGEMRALKFPRPVPGYFDHFLYLLQKETEKALPLEHPNIVRTYALEEVGDYVFVVQQLVEGSDLKATLNKPRTLEEQAELVAKVADALSYAHGLQIIHCDLKPANILVDENDNPLITDFGLAFHENEQMDMPNEQCGSPAYMSPQLVKGLIRDIDGRTDVFSLGVILYELLTNRRPFRGNTRDEIYRQIEVKDPTSPRQYDECEADRELSNICIKCLAKPARERYDTAADLADDLRDWIKGAQESSGNKPKDIPKVVLKGLRPYGPDDSEFFLELLPGPRDRKSIPESINFWKQRIFNSETPDEVIPIGFLLGPSGSGKSSFVRAGLIPQLKQSNKSIEDIYIESTAHDTEVRLIRALRKRFDAIPSDASLPEMIAGLSRGKWREGEHANKKLLIVLDQFEQRLSRNDAYQHSQLAKALEHCDGESIQCLILCRDDFWLAATRFADALEKDIREGQNCQSIDLFDKAHARQVLVKFGQHLKKLPTDESKFSKEQNAFLDSAIEQLARANFIICVRLTLFVEMFKHRPWTEQELKNVGGVAGVGEQFLESMFGQDSTSKYRTQRKLVQSILETLLPDSGSSSIRGSMKTEEELILATNAENRRQAFKEVINVLDGELKLIIRTDPDSAGDTSVSGDDKPSDKIYFQLTHDYLVPSVRNWIYRSLKYTFAGYSRFIFVEAANSHSHNKNYLPGPLDSIRFAFFVSKVIKAKHSEFWNAVLRKLMIQLALLFVIGVMITIVANRALNFVGESVTKSEIAAATSCSATEFPGRLNKLEDAEKRVLKLLPSRAQVEDSSERLRVFMIRLAFGETVNSDSMDWAIRFVLEGKREESRNLVLALSTANEESKNYAHQFVIQRIKQSNNSDSETGCLAWALGLSQPAKTAANNLSDPSCSTRISQSLFHYLTDWQPVIQTVNHGSAEDANLVFLLLTAVGNTPPEHFQPSNSLRIKNSEQIKSFVLRCSTSDDAGIQAIAKWTASKMNWIKASEQKPKEDMNMVFIQGGEIDRSNTHDKQFDEEGYSVPKLVGENKVSDFWIGDSEVSRRTFLYYAKNSKGTDYEVSASLAEKLEKQQANQDKPITEISIIDAIKFCNWMSINDDRKLTPCYKLSNGEWEFDKSSNGFRLPTVKEFEFASRAKSCTVYSFGDYVNYRFIARYAVFHNFMVSSKTAAVRNSVLPNRYGLFDMIGNVSEWTWSEYGLKKFPGFEDYPPQVVMGGSFKNKFDELFSHSSQAFSGRLRLTHVGFRIARTK